MKVSVPSGSRVCGTLECSIALFTVAGCVNKSTLKDPDCCSLFSHLLSDRLLTRWQSVAFALFASTRAVLVKSERSCYSVVRKSVCVRCVHEALMRLVVLEPSCWKQRPFSPYGRVFLRETCFEALPLPQTAASAQKGSNNCYCVVNYCAAIREACVEDGALA